MKDETPEDRLVILIGEMLTGRVEDLEDTCELTRLFLQKERLLAQLEIVDRYRFGRYPSGSQMLKDLDNLNTQLGRVRRSREERRKQKP